jgi:predicted RNA-binding Zn ribbon-like protein
VSSAPVPLSLSPDLPLKFVGGHPSVDLVNTVDWTSRGLEHDRIPDYGRFTEWAEEAGVIGADVGVRLRARAAAARPREVTAAHALAIRLRWVLQRLFRAVAAREAPGEALDEFNALLTDALARLRVEWPSSGRRRIGWAWRGMGEELVSPLWPVIRLAAELLTSDDLARVRVCDAPECGWMYVDRSRNGLRRWCQMETCGTREKNRRRRG